MQHKFKLVTTGEGKMFNAEYDYALNERKEFVAEESKIDYLPYPKKNQVLPLIPIDAMAGYGTGSVQVMEHEAESFVIPTFNGADFLISVRGSSMYPKYNSGDIVACKRLQMDNLFFQWNKVYVLDTEQGALIKRVLPGADDEHIQLVSENAKYPPITIHRSVINTIALVIGVIRLE